MKSTKSLKRKSAHREKRVIAATLEAVLDERPSLCGAVKAIEVEVEAAGKALGFDVSQENWLELADQELAAYDLPLIGEKNHDRILALLPDHIRGRIRVLEQIWYVESDLLGELEWEVIEEIDQALVGLRAAMKLRPTSTPLPQCGRQLEEVA
jgi:hypothetical protein